MRIAVIGSKGILGRDLAGWLSARHEIAGLDIVDVESCETEPDRAFRVNALGSQNLAIAAQQANADYLYISSEYVFDGRSGCDYDELSLPCPINQYGRSKLAGEVLARQICPRSYIVRTAWLIGHRQENYVERVLELADRDGIVRMATDQLESPTYTLHLAEAVEKLFQTGAYGTYHITSMGACTRLEFAAFVLETACRREEVEEVENARLKRQAERPCRTVLDCRLFGLVTGHNMPEWRQGIQEYFDNRRTTKPTRSR